MFVEYPSIVLNCGLWEFGLRDRGRRWKTESEGARDAREERGRRERKLPSRLVIPFWLPKKGNKIKKICISKMATDTECEPKGEQLISPYHEFERVGKWAAIPGRKYL